MLIYLGVIGSIVVQRYLHRLEQVLPQLAYKNYVPISHYGYGFSMELYEIVNEELGHSLCCE
jgi:hypothetical protein